MRNAIALNLDPKRKVSVQGFHSIFRVAPNGQLHVEVVAQFHQRDRTEGQLEFGGLSLSGGTTVVASAAGEVRFVISKPLEAPKLSAESQEEARMRRERQLAFVESCDRDDPGVAFADDKYDTRRMRVRAEFRSLHQGLHG